MLAFSSSSLVLLMGIGVQEMLIIFLAVIFLFGAKKIPEIARGLGKGMSEFKRGMSDDDDDDDDNDKKKPASGSKEETKPPQD